MEEQDRLDKLIGQYEDEPIEQAMAQIRVKALKLKNQNVLEMGCGLGYTTELLVQQCERLIVVDGSKKALDLAKQRSYLVVNPLVWQTRVRFIHSLWEDYEPRWQLNDIVLACVLEHVEDPVALLKRAAGWLTSMGTIHIIVPNAGSLHRYIGMGMGLIKSKMDMSDGDKRIGHRRVFDSGMLKSTVAAAGLKFQRLEGILCKPMPQAWLAELTKTELDALRTMGKKLAPAMCAELYLTAER